ncbi:MAG: hypothetical protein AAGA99_00075 [Actinomycetota bacterium]
MTTRPAPPTPMEIGSRLWLALRRNRRLVALIALGALLGGTVRLWLDEPRYLASIDLAIDAPGLPTEFDPTATQPRLERVVRAATSLADRGSYLDTADEIELVLEAEGLSPAHRAAARERRGAVRFLAQSSSPETASRAALLHATAFLDWRVEVNGGASQRLADLLESQRRDAEIEVDAETPSASLVRARVERDDDLAIRAGLVDALDVVAPLTYSLSAEIEVVEETSGLRETLLTELVFAGLFAVGLIAVRELSRREVRAASDLIGQLDVLVDFSETQAADAQARSHLASAISRRLLHGTDTVQLVPAELGTTSPAALRSIAETIETRSGATVRTRPAIAESGLAVATAAAADLTLVVGVTERSTVDSLARSVRSIEAARGQSVQVVIAPARVVGATVTTEMER